MVKDPPAMQEMWVGSGRSLGEGNGNHSSIPAWEIPCTEAPGGIQSVHGVPKKSHVT